MYFKFIASINLTKNVIACDKNDLSCKKPKVFFKKQKL